jgi:hypothetical protein
MPKENGMVTMNRWRAALRNRMFLTGLGIFLLGSGPLLLVIVASGLGLTRDPNPNPVGFGILAMLSFWPSVVLMMIGFSRAGRTG